ncbi:ABC transporter ATP-binding protein [Paenibacillus sp. CAA11]|uniref:ABC transporter ATP-binding protein n=1 Tax=Paenibacillus sp. CAA11 TaxID=1532905 RepID=UPI000D38E4AA|nr:ABC transporter ATP-binding protein [Paenibacillus sp. CAA11]AWB46185.1 ABC transporter ATP-binding protein [Paenibacillus sp. CAA11]
MTEVIKFENVSKAFHENANAASSLKEIVIGWFRKNKVKRESRTFQILNDVSFSIKEGTTTGVIGENGNGKSTILKIISNIYLPDKGTVQVTGKVSSLLEIGVGFQADLTGKENVFLYGSILGLSKQEIREKYDDIVAFSEIGEFMDTAVKYYSSGMYMRLAFSVAIHVDPDILLVDEVLAVGDEVFQKKCMNKIEELRKKKKTIVFVSHDLNVVRRICDHVIYLKKDGTIEYGSPDKMVNLYLSNVYQSSNQREENNVVIFDDSQRWGSRALEIESVTFTNPTDGRTSNLFVTNDDILVEVSIVNNDNIDKAVLGFAVFAKGIGSEPVYLADRNCYLDGKVLEMSGNKTTNVSFTIKSIPFLAGEYLVSIVLYDETCQIPYDHRHQYYHLEIINNSEQMPCLVHIDCDWDF